MAEKIISYHRSTFLEKTSGHVRFDQPQIRKVVNITDQGEVFIEKFGSSSRPLRARVVSGLHAKSGGATLNSGDKALVVYENGDPELPIIVGTIDERFDIAPPADKAPAERRKEISFKGKRINFESSDEVVINCGDATIIMKKDGKIVLRGKEIISRAARNNKIKGGTVKIN